jgi:hypothetical protein
MPRVRAQAVKRVVSCASAGAAKAPLLMTRTHPIDFTAIDSAGDLVQHVADDGVPSPYAGCLRRFNRQICYSLVHCRAPYGLATSVN